MTSTPTTLPLDATDADTNMNVDDIDTDIAASISGSEVKEEPRVDEDSISTSGMIPRDDVTEVKVVSTTKTSIDTAKSLNESNNKIIKELDDEAAKTFPQMLMEVLTNDEDSDTISWLPHGRSFIIYKKKKFASKVLVKYFKATKFTSFTRKLNRWGFTRVTRGPEMGSYFHKMFLRDNPELCLRMSSLTSSKYNHSHHDPTNPLHSNSPPLNGHVMMSPGGIPGFIPAGGFGMPMVPFPFYGVPTVPPPGNLVAAKMPTIPATPAELSQQNQYINQQLQQLQWQQFQLQQFQQQQLQASQQAAASAASVSNVNNGPGTQHQQPPPGMPPPGMPPPGMPPPGMPPPGMPPPGTQPPGMQPPQMVAPFPPQQMQIPSGAPGNGGPPPPTVPGTSGAAQHSLATNQTENSQHSRPAPSLPGHQQQQLPPLMNIQPNGAPHPPQQQHLNYQQHQQRHLGASQQPPNQHPFGHNPLYQYGQQQSHPGHSPPRPHQGGNNGTNPPPMGTHGGHQPYPYQYSQQQSYHNPHPQHAQHQQYQQQQHQHQQQHYNPTGHARHIDPCLQQQTELAPLVASPPTQQQSPTPDVADEITESLEQNEGNSEGTVVGAAEQVVVKEGGGDLGV